MINPSRNRYSVDEIVVLIYTDGRLKCLWTDEIDLHKIGNLSVERASSVEFNPIPQEWEIITPDGIVRGSHPSRATAIEMEIDYLQKEM